MSASVRKYNRIAAIIKKHRVSACQKKSSVFPLLVCLLMTAWLPGLLRAGEYERAAAELSRAAVRNQKTRVAVMPFQNVGKRNFLAGTVISEKLGGQVMALGQVEVVERILLAEIMREQKLQHSGAVDRGSIKELGRVLGVDAVVAGTVMELRDGRFEVNCRLIDAQTARVLAAATVQVEKDWAESLFDDFSIGAMPAWTSFELAGPAYGAQAGGQAEDCSGARDAVRDMERSVVDVKARYWAGRLQARDIKRDSLKKNPGSEINDPELRREFYRELRRYYEDPTLRPLSGGELSRMQRTQNEIERLAESCGLSGA